MTSPLTQHEGEPSIEQKLLDIVADDHERGCQGRCYSCECGYEYTKDELAKEAAAEIERLRGINAQLCKDHNALVVDGARLQERAETAERLLSEAMEKAAGIADEFGCRRPDCTDCLSVEIAAAIRSSAPRGDSK